MGLYPDAPKVPCVVGYEVSGTIDRLGEGADGAGFAVGDRVLAMPKFGGYADVLALPSAQVMKMPASMSFEDGAAMPVVYLTAHHMMFQVGVLHPGSTVLVHSAAGGVGIAAVQLAKWRGCVVLGVASSAKHAFLRTIGVDHPIEPEGYASAARAIVGDRGVDLVLDPVGGRSWTEGYDLLGPCGRLVAFGMSAVASGSRRSLLHAISALMQVRKTSPRQLMDDNKTIAGVNMGRLFHRVDLLRPQLAALGELYEQGVVKPHVARTFPFDEAPAAHQFIHDRKAIGKVLLVP
jgi:NADPH:quinone reductase-like Zn-dependent oxidoreductase